MPTLTADQTQFRTGTESGLPPHLKKKSTKPAELVAAALQALAELPAEFERLASEFTALQTALRNVAAPLEGFNARLDGLEERRVFWTTVLEQAQQEIQAKRRPPAVRNAKPPAQAAQAAQAATPPAPGPH